MHGKVLVYGNDPILLMTRRLILEKVGCRVLTTMEFADAMLILMNQQIDLLVVCHSLRDEERQGILETARALKPDIKTVILRFTRFRGRDISGEGAEFVDGLDGPASLLAAVDKVLNSGVPAHAHV
jgi:CheY-like chemotaxis protein